MIVILDSAIANLGSIYKAVLKAGLQAEVSSQPSLILRAGGVIFPGVGSYRPAMQRLQEKGLVEVLINVIEAGTPFLGICLGLQLLFSYGEEGVNSLGTFPRGLDMLPGAVKRFPPGLTVPHVGWNRVYLQSPHPLFESLEEGSYFYFTHSYYVSPKQNEAILALTNYGSNFASAVARNNLMGVQFHPEKSGPVGLQLLRNFGRITRDPSVLY